MIEDIYPAETLFVSLNNLKHCTEDLCRPRRQRREQIHAFRDKLLARGVHAKSFLHRWDKKLSFLENGRALSQRLALTADPKINTIILAGLDSSRAIAAMTAALLIEGRNVIVVEDLLADRRFERKAKKDAEWHTAKVRERAARAVFAAEHHQITQRLDVMTKRELTRMISPHSHRPLFNAEAEMLASNADLRLG